MGALQWGLYFSADYYQSEEYDEKKALQLYEKAARQNHVSSIIKLAKYYADASDTKENIAFARYWFNIATTLGYDYDMRDYLTITAMN